MKQKCKEKVGNYLISATKNSRIDEFILRMFENMILRRTCGHVCEEVTGGWETRIIRSSIILLFIKSRWDIHVVCLGTHRHVYILLFMP
jgi:hypothetical protein